jgi:hypothetical protein
MASHSSIGEIMAGYEQTFLEQITNIQGTDFSTWAGWEKLMSWTRRQAWSKDFLGDDKIPARLLHPTTLAEELTKYLGG